jgi:hypothetical protein
MAKLGGAPAWGAMALLTSIGACDHGGDGAGGGARTGTGGQAQSATSGPVTIASGPSSTAPSTSGVGGSSYVCDPPADPGSLYELYAESLDPNKIEPVNMCEYRGDVLLIVNTAAL